MKDFNVSIQSGSHLLVPVAVQNSIKNKFAFSKNKEVFVKYNLIYETYDIYQNDRYICSFDESGK
jgi:hypothetical protein